MIDSGHDHLCPTGLRINEILEENIHIITHSEDSLPRSNLGTNTSNYNTTTTTDDTTYNNADEISTDLPHFTPSRPDESIPTIENSTENSPGWDPTSTTPMITVRENISRVCPPRSSKTKALEQIRAMSNSLPDDD